MRKVNFDKEEVELLEIPIYVQLIQVCIVQLNFIDYQIQIYKLIGLSNKVDDAN